MNYFDLNFYRNAYADLKNLNDIQLKNHWINHGIKENRLSNINRFNELYPHFNPIFYKNYNLDLSNYNNYELIAHYWHYGSKEGRICFNINSQNYKKIPDNNNKNQNINDCKDSIDSIDIIVNYNFNNNNELNKFIENIYNNTIINYNLFIINKNNKIAIIKDKLKNNVKIIDIIDKNYDYEIDTINFLIKNSESKYIIFSNSYFIPNKNWESYLVNTLDSDEKIFGVSPITNNSKNTSKISIEYKNENDFFDKAVLISEQLVEYFDVYSIDLFCFCFRKNDFLNINNFEKKFQGKYLESDMYEKIVLYDKKIVVSTKSIIYNYINQVDTNLDENMQNKLFYFEWNKNFIEKKYEPIIKKNKFDNSIYFKKCNCFIDNNIIYKYISFIIPSLGRQSINSTLKSLINQNELGWECIIVYDNTEKKHDINDLRIKYFNIEKKGIHTNNKSMAGLVRNEGIKYVNTEWIGFIDDDDNITDDYLEKFKLEIKLNENLDCIIFRMCYKNNEIIPIKNTKNIKKNNIGISFCFKKNTNIYFNNSFYEDYEFLKELEIKKYMICISPYITYIIRDNNLKINNFLGNAQRIYINNLEKYSGIINKNIITNNYYSKNYLYFDEKFYNLIFYNVINFKNHYINYGIIEGRLSRIPYYNEKDFKPYNILNKKIFAIYFPQFHETLINNKVWGKGWTDFTNLDTTCKDNLSVIRPEFTYDLLNYEIRKNQAIKAKLNGIYGFAIYNYYFYGDESKKKILNKPMELMLQDGEPNLPFYFIWANETWTKKWDGGQKEITVLQEYHSNINDLEEHFLYLLPYFRHKNYYKYQNKLVFSIYKIFDISEVKLNEFINYFNKRLIENNLPELFLLQCMGSHWEHKHKFNISNYVDGIYETQPNLTFRTIETLYNNKNLSYDHYKLQKTEDFYKIMNSNNIYKYICKNNLNKKIFRGHFFHFDNTCRLYKRGNPIKFDFLNEEKYINYLTERLAISDEHLIINAWNEWGEGMAIEQTNLFDNNKINFLEIINKSIIKFIKKGIGITTYFNKFNEIRFGIFKECIESLINTNFDGNIYVCDDCSNDVTHIEYLKNLGKNNIKIFINENNLGISKNKNNCIKYMLEDKCDILFLSDDDIIFENDWSFEYTNALLKSGVHMLTADVVDEKQKINTKINNEKQICINGIKFKYLTMPEGPFIAMTRKVPETIGGFNNNFIYGYEHIYYTLRTILKNLAPCTLDILNTKIRLNHLQYKNSSIEESTKINEINKSLEFIKNNKINIIEKI